MSASRNTNQILNQQIAMLKKASAQRYTTNRRTPIDERRNSQQRENQGTHSQLGRNSYAPLNPNKQNSVSNLQRQNSNKQKTRNLAQDKILQQQANTANEAYMLQQNLTRINKTQLQANHTYNSQQNMKSALNASQQLYDHIKHQNSSFAQNTQVVPLSENCSQAKIQNPDVKKVMRQSHSKKQSGGSKQNSQKQSVEGFFNQRNANSRESLRQAIKTYKDGIDPNQVSSRNGDTQKIFKAQRHKSQPRVNNNLFFYESSQMDKLKGNYKEFNLLSQNNKKGLMNLSENINFEQSNTQNNISQVLNSSDFVGQDNSYQNQTHNLYQNQLPSAEKSKSLTRQIPRSTLKKCTCQCPQHQETTSQTTRMMSILSTGPNNIRNTLTLRIGPSAITHSEGAHTTFVEEPPENSDLEEMHYLMVQVEKMKKQMLGRIEKSNDPNLDYPTLEPNFDELNQQEQNSKCNVIQY